MGQSQADYLEEFIQKRLQYADRTIRSDILSERCMDCAELPAWRCEDCLGRPQWCRQCCLGRHRLNPFHRVHAWYGKCWTPASLSGVGVVVHLGAGEMESCRCGRPHPRKNMTLVDTSGVHELPVSYCPEADGGDSLDLQLLDAGFMPASFTSPDTAFTFPVIRAFLLENVECNTSATQFFLKLRRITKPDFPHKVADRRRELERAARCFYNMEQWKEKGFMHKGGIPGVGDLVDFCPACPQPDVNLPDDWKEDPER